MQFETGNVGVDMIALRKQFKLRVDEKAEAHHVQEFFNGKHWHVLAEAGGSRSNWGMKRFISSSKTYDSAMQCFNGWRSDKPLLIYFQTNGEAVLVESSHSEQQAEADKNKLALADGGILKLSEKERNRIICALNPAKILELGPDHGPEAIWMNVPNGKVYYNRLYNGRFYSAIEPMRDSERMAALGERLLFIHRAPGESAGLIVAQKGVVVSPGWVVGLFKP